MHLKAFICSSSYKTLTNLSIRSSKPDSRFMLSRFVSSTLEKLYLKESKPTDPPYPTDSFPPPTLAAPGTRSLCLSCHAKPAKEPKDKVRFLSQRSVSVHSRAEV